MIDDPAALIVGIAPSDLLPERRRDEAGRIALPLEVLGSARLDDDHGVAVVRDARGVTYGLPWVQEGPGIRRARAGDGTAQALVAQIAAGGTDGTLDITAFGAEVVVGERAIDVDQTNDLVVVGERAVVKWALHPEPEGGPGPRRLSALAQAGFAGTPATWAIVHLPTTDGPLLVATVTAFLADAQDGWDWAVDAVRAHARGEASDIDAAVEAVGRLVGALHVALSGEGVRPASAEQARRWADGARADAAAAGLDAVTAARVSALLDAIGRCAGATTMPIHGDLHIGQVLRTGDPARYLVIDFDGSPMLTPAERQEWQPAARDVAGMLASLDHVGRVVLHRTEDLDPAARERVRAWIEQAQDAFLAAYRQELLRAGCADLLDRDLLVAMQVQQECREYAYADRYLPHWRYVPDAALPALLERTDPRER